MELPARCVTEKYLLIQNQGFARAGIDMGIIAASML
jgi:hypothetical protein